MAVSLIYLAVYDKNDIFFGRILKFLAVFEENKMDSKNKKFLLLEHLSTQEMPITLHQLLDISGKEYSDRSVRRWLTELINEGLVEKSGQKRGTKYQIIRRVEEVSQGNEPFTAESKKTIEQVRRPLYERNPISYEEDWFNAYVPNDTFYIPLETRLRLVKAGKRVREEDPAGTYAHQIFNRLLIDLSYNSSRLEGNTYSLLDTERLLLQGASAEGKLDEEKVMILNHKEAIRYLVDTAPRLSVSVETISTLHYLLSDGLVENRYAGKVRDHAVRIGGSTYIPLENPKKLQAQLGHIVEKAAQIKDPYEQSLFLLIHITYLQAFTDVNKRTGRLSANISLIKENLVPLSFNDVEKDDYNSAMIAIYEFQNVKPLVDLYKFSYMRTCIMYDSTVKAIGFDEIRVRYRQQRRALIREIILKKLVGEKMQKYISSQSQKIADDQERANFIEDVLEDLKEIDLSRIAGLGISGDQLSSWKKKNLEP